MVRLRNKLHRRGKRAFTLVELIVVLVILAVLAAMLVPALTGYIRKSRRAKYYDMAYAAREAAQAVMTELYGLYGDPLTDPSRMALTDDGNNINWFGLDTNTGINNSEYGDRVLALMGLTRETAPDVLIIGVGYSGLQNHVSHVDLDASVEYTVYYLAYLQDQNSPAVFYVNGEWRYIYPTESPSLITKTKYNVNNRTVNINTITSTGMPLHFIVICNRYNIPDGQLWINNARSLQMHSQGHNGY